MTGSVQQLSLLGSLSTEWYRFPTAVMRDVGPATQTLAGLLLISRKETFLPAAKIADRSRIPLKTVRKHLETLHDRGWIENTGRQQTRTGTPRRTCTIKITKQTRDSLEDFCPLPWWAPCPIRGLGKMDWSTRAVFSVVMRRLMELRAVALRSEDPPDETDEDGIAATIENLDTGRFCLSLTQLCEITGLTRESASHAKRSLHESEIICWQVGDGADLLMPNWEFRLNIKSCPTEDHQNRCQIYVGRP